MSEEQYTKEVIDLKMESLHEVLKKQDKVLSEILAGVRYTNGTVRGLQQWKSGIVGALSVGSVVAGLIIYIWTTQINQIKASESQIASTVQAHINK